VPRPTLIDYFEEALQQEYIVWFIYDWLLR